MRLLRSGAERERQTPVQAADAIGAPDASVYDASRGGSHVKTLNLRHLMPKICRVTW